MSWFVEFRGTKEAVRKKVEAAFDQQAKTYEGKEEGKDILACKERALVLIDACVMEDFANGLEFKASGSHSASSAGLMSANFSVSVTRIHLSL